MPDPTSNDDQVLKLKMAVATGVRTLAAAVHAREAELGHWSGDETDHRPFFAELHSLLSRAYETYDDEPDPRKLTWFDATSGNEVAAGEGQPQGLAVDLAMVIFRLLAFCQAVGIDMGAIVADMGIGVPIDIGEFNIDSISGPGPDDNHDLELAELLGPTKETPPETPPGEKTPDKAGESGGGQE